MRLADFPEPIRDCLGTYEALRRIGYLPEEIYFCTFRDGVGMQLQHAGKKFTWARSWPERRGDADDLTALWGAAASKWNGVGAADRELVEAERQEIWAGWLSRNSSVDFLTSIAAAGLPINSDEVAASRRAVH